MKGTHVFSTKRLNEVASKFLMLKFRQEISRFAENFEQKAEDLMHLLLKLNFSKHDLSGAEPWLVDLLTGVQPSSPQKRAFVQWMQRILRGDCTSSDVRNLEILSFELLIFMFVTAKDGKIKITDFPATVGKTHKIMAGLGYDVSKTEIALIFNETMVQSIHRYTVRLQR
jgi:hypothetical protein